MKVISQLQNGIWHITLNRPEKRNAMDGELISLLRHNIRDALADNACRALLISAEGEHFCAGADIAEMQAMINASYEHNVNDAQNLADALYELYRCPKPTIVLAQGATLGGGLGLLAVADIAIAADNAVFGFSEVKLGLIPAVISPFIIRAIGERAAQFHFLLGEKFDAHEAKHLGLIHQIVSQHDLLTYGNHIALSLINHGPLAMKSIKKLTCEIGKLPISERISQETAEILAQIRITSEAQEGLKAFLQKRAPEWSNK